jgi:hypothetical protein
MVYELAREPDELWTSYLVRMMKDYCSSRFDLHDLDPDDIEIEKTGEEPSYNINLEFRIETAKSWITIYRSIVNPKAILIDSETYGDIIREGWDEGVSVDSKEDSNVGLSVFFLHDGNAFINNNSWSEGRFSKYIKEQTYKAADIIDDIIVHAFEEKPLEHVKKGFK